MNNVFINFFDLCVYQDQNKSKNKLNPFENNESTSDKVIDLLIYENHYDLIKTLHIILSKHDSEYICRRSFSFISSQNVLKKQRQ